MKTITDKVRAAWAKLPDRAQSAVRHLVTTFVVTFAVTAQPLLAGVYAAPDLKTAKALALAAILAAGVAAVRVCVPLAIVYGKALGAWLLARLAS
jgi:hypothetical protein